MSKPPSADSILRHMKDNRKFEPKAEVASEMFLPNHSGVDDKAEFRRENEIRHAKYFISIQAAIDDLPSTGGTVFIDAGTFIISSPIIINCSNTTIEGEGDVSIIFLENGSNCDMIQSNGKDNIEIKNVYLKGNKDNQIGVHFHGLEIVLGSNIKIENCKIEEVVYDGIYLSDCDDCKISGCYIINCDRNGIGNGEASNFKSNRIKITNNTIHGCENAGIDIEPGEFTIISSNNFEGNNVGIIMNGTVTYNPTNYCIISNNSINNSTLEGIYIDKMDHITITANTLTNNTTWGIRILAGVDNVTLIGNVFYGNGTSALSLAGTNIISLANAGYTSDNLQTNNLTANSLHAGDGATGSFTTVDLKTVTVVDGIITAIV